MEAEYARTQKELTNLQHLNKFLMMSEKKKDDMISYLFEENRALKNEVLELQKSLEKNKHKNSKNLNQNLDSSFFNSSLNPKLTIPIPPSLITASNFPPKKASNFNLAAISETFTRRKTKVYEDDLAYKNLLNMNLSNSFLKFKQN